jgi:phosphomevalonate kinase
VRALEATGPAARVIAGVLAAKDLGATLGSGVLDVDSRALFDGDRKLGFGSSAAVCVATFAAACAASRVRWDLRRAFVACKEQHNRAQGSAGSGGDIAASLAGGLAWLRGNELGRFDSVPPLAVLFHPHSASTPQFISNTKRFKQEQPLAYARHVAGLGAIAEKAAQDRSALAWVALVREACAALDAFGKASGTAIVTDYQREVSAICDALGAASKPAGAGGGDVSLLCAPDDTTLAAAMAAIRKTGGHCEPLAIAAQGAS